MKDRESTFEQEVAQGLRFEFGKNWAQFLKLLNDERIERATQGLSELLCGENLRGKTFLDVGSGSGLSSLAAWRLGATVTSFDYDPSSVGCTQELHRRYAQNDDSRWKVERGSALDKVYLCHLGQFDVVYSWGVLHHTGQMWNALENMIPLVKPDGLLAVAIYNDQGITSRAWLKIKQTYCSGWLGRAAMSAICIPYFVAKGVAYDIVTLTNPLKRYRESGARGMSVVRDWFDWIGGLPFEVAKPEQILKLYRRRGYELVNLSTVAGNVGCNEFLFRAGAPGAHS